MAATETGIRATDRSVQVLDQFVDSVVAENSSRGGNGYLASCISALERRQMKARMENPFSYTAGDVLDSPDGFRYRRGREDGMPFFTVDDFLRLRKAREQAKFGPLRGAFAVELYENSARMLQNPRPAQAYRCADGVVADSLAPRSEVFFANGEGEMVVRDRSRAENRLSALWKKYAEAPMAILVPRRRRFSSGVIASVALTLIFTVLLAMPVVLKILMHEKSMEIAELDRKIRTAQAEVTQLEIELEQKNDRATLEKLAVETYGMVRLDHSDYSVLRLNTEDTVETVEKEQSGGAVPSLLKALGLRSGD